MTSPYLEMIVSQISSAHRMQRECKSCPFCGHDTPLAHIVCGKYVVGCDNDECAVSPQASDSTLQGAWAKWDRRA